jgi:SAM-dependent methyltransferase
MDQATIDRIQQMWIAHQANIHPPALQIGCGMKPIPGALNTDPNPERARWADTPADAHALPFEPETFGCVVSSHVINNLRDPVLAFREMARVLVPGGWICHVIPDWRYAPDRKSSRYPFDKHHYGWRGPDEFSMWFTPVLGDLFEMVELANFTEFNWSFKLRAVKL